LSSIGVQTSHAWKRSRILRHQADDRAWLIIEIGDAADDMWVAGERRFHNRS